MKKKNVVVVLDALSKMYPNPKPPLEHDSAYTLLVAVMLSAQCTDARVNIVTKSLFPKYETPQKMLSLGEIELKQLIRSCGYFNAKAKNIIAMSHELIERFEGGMPGTLEELITLPGVGRKTASVVLTQWFKIPAVPVDTHVHRVANRLGFCHTKTPDKTEMALRKTLPESSWIDAHLQLIFHGRTLCTARKPRCKECLLKDWCKWRAKQ